MIFYDGQGVVEVNLLLYHFTGKHGPRVGRGGEGKLC